MSLVIWDEVQSNLIFSNASGESGMLHLLLEQTQALLEATQQDQVTYWRAGDALCVFGAFSNIRMLLTATDKPAVRSLQNALRIYYDLLLLEFGPVQLHEKRGSSYGRHRMRIQSLLDTASSLSAQHVEFSLHALSPLELSDDIRGRCGVAVKSACAQVGGAVAHALLLVDNKLLTHFERPRALPLHALDQYLLAIQARAILDPPPVDGAAPMAVPVADYSAINLDDELDVGEDDGVDEDPPARVDTPPPVPPAMVPPAIPPLSRLTTMFLRAKGDTSASAQAGFQHVVPRKVYFAKLSDSISLVLVGSGREEGMEKAMDSVRDLLMQSLIKDYGEYLQARACAHLSMMSYVYKVPGLVHFVFIDRSAHRVLAPVIEPLHGQACISHTPESSAHMVQTLQKFVMQLIHFGQDALTKGSVSSLMRRGPFVYSTRLWIEDGDGFELMIDQALFSNTARPDVPSAVAPAIDDGLGDDLPRAASSAASLAATTDSTVWGPTFYDALVERVLPSQKRYVRCYELYTLYVGMATVQQVAQSDRKLLNLLPSRFGRNT